MPFWRRHVNYNYWKWQKYEKSICIIHFEWTFIMFWITINSCKYARFILWFIAIDFHYTCHSPSHCFSSLSIYLDHGAPIKNRLYICTAMPIRLFSIHFKSKRKTINAGFCVDFPCHITDSYLHEKDIDRVLITIKVYTFNRRRKWIKCKIVRLLVLSKQTMRTETIGTIRSLKFCTATFGIVGIFRKRRNKPIVLMLK